MEGVAVTPEDRELIKKNALSNPPKTVIFNYKGELRELEPYDFDGLMLRGLIFETENFRQFKAENITGVRTGHPFIPRRAFSVIL